jgi:indole-3-acetate monooxygenase
MTQQVTPIHAVDAPDVAQLGEEAAARRAELDERASIPADLYEQAALHGLFRQLVPAELGGLGYSPLEWFRTGLCLARHEPSLGWVVAQGAAILGYVANGGDPSWAEEVLSDPRSATAASIAGAGALEPEGDGYRFQGRWSFTSGCEGATWLGGIAVIGPSDGAPPEFRWGLVPAERARIERTWDASGLRGTGSHTVVVEEQHIPATWTVSSFAPSLYRSDAHAVVVGNGNWPIGSSVAAIQLGIARRALDEVTALLPHKCPAPDFQPLSTSTAVQRGLMEAEGLWVAALRGVEAALERMWAVAREHARLDVSLRVDLATANATANRLAVGVTDQACELAGTTSVPVDHPLNRSLRDAYTLRSHISTNAAVLDRAARVHLGIEDPGPLV